MRLFAKIIIATALWTLASYATADCILLQKIGTTAPFHQEGKCEKGESPWSTFKIAIAIMGYNGGVLQDTQKPVWKFQEGYDDWLPIWREDQTPKSWIKNSVVWYSQVITQKLGKDFVVKELDLFDYGNKDFSDANGKKGITDAWLGGALKISPVGQVRFLSLVAQGKLLDNKKDFLYLKDLLKQDQVINGWTLYGKTGSSGLNKTPAPNTPYKVGWFVGWLEKDDIKIVFVNFQQQMKLAANISGPTIRDSFLKALHSYLDAFEK